MRKILFFLSIAAVTGCAYMGYVRDPFADIPNFYQVTNQLYRGGYPKQHAYAMLKERGIKTIINLSGNDARADREKEVCARMGFSYVHIPLSVYVWPRDEQVLLFLKTVLSPAEQPVFVHCGRGRDCTGAMIAVYRVVVEHKGPKEGYREALRYGFWPYRGETVLKKYIHQLRDRKNFFTWYADCRKKGECKP